MEEEIKILEEWIEHWGDGGCIDCGYNDEAKHNQAIKNLINKCKELRKNYKNLLASAEILKEASEEQEKMIELMAEHIEAYMRVYPHYKKTNKEEWIEFFRKKAKGE